MVFSPSKRLGLAVGLAAALGLLGAAGLAVALIVSQPIAFLTFLLIVFIGLSLALIAWIAFRCAGLAGARYVVSRNALIVIWGGRREVIPMGEVAALHAGRYLAEPVRVPWLRWPGCVVGRRAAAGQAPVEFFATTAAKPGLMFVEHSGGWLALSPSEPGKFLSTFEEMRALGVEDFVEAESIETGAGRWPLWRDRLALALIGAGGLALLALIAYLTLIFPALPDEMALRFAADGQPERFGPPAGLFILPVIGATAWVLNTLIGGALHRAAPQRAVAYLLFGAAAFVQALVWAAAIGLLTAGAA